MLKKTVAVKNIKIGEGFCVIGGPCAIESEEQLLETASAIQKNIHLLRGGAFKPRTSPQDFQGLGEEGLVILKKISKKLNIPTVTEVLDVRDIEMIAEHTDVLQVGARNMQNFPLLKELGRQKKPVLLKRGAGNTIKEWIKAVEYITNEGNEQVILCERGIRTFEDSTRFTLDLAGAVLIKEITGLPVITDPSHATGLKNLIKPLVLASKSAGLDGVMIETHYAPQDALCDGKQSLTTEEFNQIIASL